MAEDSLAVPTSVIAVALHHEAMCKKTERIQVLQGQRRDPQRGGGRIWKDGDPKQEKYMKR